jgi:hypothetical protein
MQSKESQDIDIALVGDSHAEQLFLGMAEALPNKNIVFYIQNAPLIMGQGEFKNIFSALANSKTIKIVLISMFYEVRESQISAGQSFDIELVKIIDMLSRTGKEIYLVEDTPFFKNNPSDCKNVRFISPKKSLCEIGSTEADRQRQVFDNLLIKISNKRPQIRVIRTRQNLCNNVGCRMTMNDKILYRDWQHLNLSGSSYIGKKIVEENLEVFK